MEYPVGPWARERFGERAAHVCAALMNALHRALANAQDAHRTSESTDLLGFGAVQRSRRYACSVEA